MAVAMYSLLPDGIGSGTNSFCLAFTGRVMYSRKFHRDGRVVCDHFMIL